MNIIGEKLYKALIEEERYLAYLEGLKITIEISLLAILLGVVIGILVAIINVTARERKGLKWLSLVCSLYINIIRGTPLMVQLLIFANLIFVSRENNEVVIGAVCFGINSGAYVAEIIRAGIESIDQGQTEAGRSLGQ